MAFGDLSPTQRIRVILDLQRAQEYVRRMSEAAAATSTMAARQSALEAATKKANVQGAIHNQMLYTQRRFAFYGTLGILGLGAAVFRLGLNFYNTTQAARVAFAGMLGGVKPANDEIRKMYILAASSPFEFPDIVIATRRLMPFVKNLEMTNELVSNVADSLAGMGILTGAAMTRATLQLSHMFAVGRLTGQILYNLGRDNIPMMQALQEHFHMTGEEVRKSVAGGLISAEEAARALSTFIRHDPAFSRAAFRQATGTLVGAWATFKDLLGMSAGGAESGMFEGIRKQLQAIDFQLIDMAKHGNVTFTDLVEAIDRQLSPHTHVVINLFEFFRMALRTVIGEFYLLIATIGYILRPLDWLGSRFGANRLAAKVLGFAFGTLIALMILGRTVTLLEAEAQTVARIATIKWGNALILFNRAKLFEDTLVAQGALRKVVFVNNGLMAKFARMVWRTVPALKAAAIAAWEFTAALLANPITWIVAGVIALTVTFLVLYYKWKRFHDLINNNAGIKVALMSTFMPIITAAAALKYIIDNMDRLGSHVRNTLQWSPGGDLGGPAVATGTSEGHHTSWWKQALDPGILVGRPGAFFGQKSAAPARIDNSKIHGTVAVNVYPQHIYMDGKKVGEAVATAYTDKAARS